MKVLAIRDDYDLKELEEIGFKKRVKYISNGEISICPKTRYILVNNVGYSPYGDFVPNKNMYNSQRLFIPSSLMELVLLSIVIEKDN